MTELGFFVVMFAFVCAMMNAGLVMFLIWMIYRSMNND